MFGVLSFLGCNISVISLFLSINYWLSWFSRMFTAFMKLLLLFSPLVILGLVLVGLHCTLLTFIIYRFILILLLQRSFLLPILERCISLKYWCFLQSENTYTSVYKIYLENYIRWCLKYWLEICLFTKMNGDKHSDNTIWYLTYQVLLILSLTDIKRYDDCDMHIMTLQNVL